MAGKPESRSFIPLQKDRVAIGIIARGLLSLQEIRVCMVVMVESWGWNQRTTNPEFPVTVLYICEVTGMDKRPAQRVWKALQEQNIIISHPDGSYEFNEHIELWRRPNRSPKTTKSVAYDRKGRDQIGRQKRPNRSHKTTKSVVKNDLIGRFPLYTEKQEKQEKQEKGAPDQKGPLPTTSKYLKVYQVLKSIDVPAYRRIHPEPEWERDLADVIADPGRDLDLPGLIAEAKKFRTWFEDSIRCGKIKRDQRHRPRQRFVNGWLRRITRENRDNGSRYSGESPTDKALREYRAKQLAPSPRPDPA